MQAQQIYLRALALVQETPGKERDLDGFALPYLNMLLAECFAANNAQRDAAGKPALEKIPQLSALTGEVELEESFCARALPYGLAALLKLDDDAQQANYFNLEYKAALERLSVGTHGEVRDCY